MSYQERISMKIRKWFTQLDLRVKVIQSQQGDIFICNFTYEGRQFLVQTSVKNDWINIKGLVCLGSKIPPEKREAVYQALLVANFRLNEVCFSIDPKHGNIFVESDQHVETATFEDFRMEFQSLPAGFAYFVKEIAPQLGIELPDTASLLRYAL